MKESPLLGITINGFFLVRGALAIIVAVAVFSIFIGVPVFVNGVSMEPNFQSGQLVAVERLSYSGNKEIRRGDVVAARFPADPDQTRLIKRVIGLPRETVELRNGVFFVNGTKLDESYQPLPGEPPYQEIKSITLKEKEYFLVGDNRPNSSDSRLWGPVVKADILGRVSLILFPFNEAQYIERSSSN